MEIKTININELKPYENNAKLHPAEQIEQIKNSIKEFGNNDPIAVDENNVIIEGHGRYEALKQLGYKTAEIIQLTGLTEDQKNAYRIVHNQLTMNTDWNMDILKAEINKISLDMSDLGIELDLLNQIEDEYVEVKEDDFNVEEALLEEPTAKQGDIYLLGNHRLMCGDSTNSANVSLLMNGEYADLLVTDPPYNVAISNSQGMTIENDDMNRKEFISFLIKAFKNAFDNLKCGAAFYIWYASREHMSFETALQSNDVTVKEQLIWVKNTFVLGRQDYHWRHEPCLYGWKDGATHYFIDDRKQSTVIDDTYDFDTMPAEDLRKYVKSLHEFSSVIYEKKPTINDVHPTMKPLKLMGRLVKNSSKKDNAVLDLFGGSGSTLIACEQLNRRCYMMEYDPKYVDVIIDRWETFTGNKAIKL